MDNYAENYLNKPFDRYELDMDTIYINLNVGTLHWSESLKTMHNMHTCAPIHSLILENIYFCGHSKILWATLYGNYSVVKNMVILQEVNLTLKRKNKSPGLWYFGESWS